MSMIPIVKLPHPQSSGKCYPLSVYESILNTKAINVANNIGGYKKGDIIQAETNYDVIFRKIMEVEADPLIVTNFDSPNDTTVPSSKLVKDELDKISLDISGKEDVGVAAALVSALENGKVKTNTENIAINTQSINILNSDKNTRGSVAYAIDQLEFGKVKSNTDRIIALENGKQDKLHWLSVAYDPDTNKAVTAADLNSTKQELEEKFAKVTNFRGIFTKNPGEEAIDTLRRCVLDPKNGDFAIVDDDEFIYATQDSSWHLLGNVSGYIKSGTHALRNDDFDSNYKISQDYIIGLVEIQTNVTNLLGVENRCNTYTNGEISKLKNSDEAISKQFVTKVLQTNGVATITRRSLESSDLPVATSNTIGAIKPGNNCVVDENGTLNVTGGSGGIGDVVGPSSSVVNHIATFSSDSGKVIKDSGFTIEKSVPADAKFTDTLYTQGSGITISNNTINHTNSVTAKTELSLVKITYDTQGHITGISNVEASDIPTLTLSKISDAGTFASKNSLSVSDIPAIDVSSGKITGLGELATRDSLDKSDVGLDNVDNTSDADKPISNATQTELNKKANIASLGALAYENSLDKSDVGLSNVDNTSDVDKPISNPTKQYVNNMKFSSSDTADLTSDDGVIDAVKRILIKLGMKESNIVV